MDKLHERALREFAIGLVLLVFLGILCFGLAIDGELDNIKYAIICLAAGSVYSLIFYMIEMRGFKKYDEREKTIYLQALMFSSHFFIGFMCCVIPIHSFIVDLKDAEAPSMLFLLLVGLFIKQFVHAAIILIKCPIKESNG